MKLNEALTLFSKFNSLLVVRLVAVVLTFGLFLSSFSEARTLEDIRKNGILRIASEGAYPPFNFFKGKDLVGYEIEVAEAVAQQLNLKWDWKTFPFDSLLVGLSQDRYDVVIASHAITEERAKAVSFTLPHYCSGGTLLSRVGGALKANDLAGKTVATQVGTSYLEHLKKIQGLKAVKTYPKDTDSLQNLLAGRADVVITDRFVALEAAKKYARSSTPLQVGEVLFQERVAMAVSKGNEGLVKALNSALTTYLKSPAALALSQKYFETDVRCP